MLCLIWLSAFSSSLNPMLITMEKSSNRDIVSFFENLGHAKTRTTRNSERNPASSIHINQLNDFIGRTLLIKFCQ